MKKNPIFIILTVLISFHLSCFAQIPVKLSTPYLEIKANTVNIYYNIINSSEANKFNIWVEITDSTGNKINAHSLYGDLGNNVGGGNNKMITWDFVRDSILNDTGIYIQIYAEPLPQEKAEEIIPSVRKEIHPGLTVFQSILFPGWGLSRINKGSPHWIKGLTGYGLIATSIIYNRKAISSYNDYLNASDIQVVDELYKNSVKQDNISEICAYTAIGIWVIDLVWTLADSSKLKKNNKYSQIKGFSINPEYEPYTKMPVFAFRYTF